LESCALDNPKNRGAETGRAGLVLLFAIETSLQASQRALLAGEVSVLEQHTQEQARLCQAFASLGFASLGWQPASPEHSTPPETACVAQGHACAQRVLHLGRVQAALLGRAERRLRMIENLQAGLARSYAPPAHRRIPARSATGGPSCRA
jgi:hypothetical protein